MKKGVVVIRTPYATAKRQQKFFEVLSEMGWACEMKQRFDGVLIVSFERPDSVPDISKERLEALLAAVPSWSSQDCMVKILE